MSEVIKILVVPGSLRASSLHLGLARAAAELAPSGVQVDIQDLRGIPLFDGDLTEIPPAVDAFRGAVEAADGVLFASPEYNFSISGVLKNAIDWGSRPAYASPFHLKKCAMMSTSGGPVGGARGLEHLKLVLHGMGSHLFPGRTLTFGAAKTRFDDKGNFVDEKSRQLLADYIEGFAAFVRG